MFLFPIFEKKNRKSKHPEMLLLIGDSNVTNPPLVEYHVPLTLTISQSALSNYFRITTKLSSQSNSASSHSNSSGNSNNNSQFQQQQQQQSHEPKIDPNLCLQFFLNAQDQSQLDLNSIQFTIPSQQ